MVEIHNKIQINCIQTAKCTRIRLRISKSFERNRGNAHKFTVHCTVHGIRISNRLPIPIIFSQLLFEIFLHRLFLKNGFFLSLSCVFFHPFEHKIRAREHFHHISNMFLFHYTNIQNARIFISRSSHILSNTLK